MRRFRWQLVIVLLTGLVVGLILVFQRSTSTPLTENTPNPITGGSFTEGLVGEIMRLTLLGNFERMSAGRALQIGLVQEVVPADVLLSRAQQVAREIAEGPPIAVQGTVRSIWLATELARSQAVDLAHVMVGLGNDPALLGEGQDRFASGQRVEWRLR